MRMCACNVEINVKCDLNSVSMTVNTKFAISSPDSFTSRMKSLVTPVVQVSSRLEI